MKIIVLFTLLVLLGCSPSNLKPGVREEVDIHLPFGVEIDMVYEEALEPTNEK